LGYGRKRKIEGRKQGIVLGRHEGKKETLCEGKDLRCWRTSSGEVGGKKIQQRRRKSGNVWKRGTGRKRRGRWGKEVRRIHFFRTGRENTRVEKETRSEKRGRKRI